MLKLYNYTRVLHNGELLDHLEYLRRSRPFAAGSTLTVWEMYLCSGLLLAAHLERNGHEVLLVNYLDSENLAHEGDRLRAFDPHIVALSTTFVLTPKHLRDAATMIRRIVPDAFLVAGGHHVFTTLLYLDELQRREYLSNVGVDALVNDVQGETTLLGVADAWPNRLHLVPNLVWQGAEGGAAETTRFAEENDINSTLIEFRHLPEGAVVHIRTARSCSFKCAFCSYPTVAGDLALMHLDNAILTMRRARDAGAGAVFFVDDTFNVPRPRFERLIDKLIEADLGLPWYSFIRGQFVDQRLIEKMRRSGCRGVFLGIESGSDEVLKNMDKGSAVKHYAPAIRWLREQDILTVGAFVIGFPGETQGTVEQTAEFIETSGLDFYFLQPFYYLHHTPVHKVADRFGLKGKGLDWVHATMKAHEACDAIDRLFLRIHGPVFVNPDYTLWEVAYLLQKGLSLTEVIQYRRTINAMTAAQMTGIGGTHVTSRPVRPM